MYSTRRITLKSPPKSQWNDTCIWASEWVAIHRWYGSHSVEKNKKKKLRYCWELVQRGTMANGFVSWILIGGITQQWLVLGVGSLLREGQAGGSWVLDNISRRLLLGYCHTPPCWGTFWLVLFSLAVSLFVYILLYLCLFARPSFCFSLLFSASFPPYVSLSPSYIFSLPLSLSSSDTRVSKMLRSEEDSRE